MTAAKITTAAKIVSTVCKVVSNAATFTQAAIGGVNNAKAIVKNMINGKLFSEDTAKNLVSFGINAFTAATSGKNLLSSSKELKKVVGDSVGSKWGKKAKKEPLLECNLQFFADKSGANTNPNYIVTPEGVVMPTNQDFNLVSTTTPTNKGGEYIQIHNQHTHGNLNNPHTHKPQINVDPVTGIGSSKRLDIETSARDINYADKSMKNGNLRIRFGKKDKGGY